MTADIGNCLQALKAGGLILYPTDTIWGIGCDATNASAVDRVFRLKRRDDRKSLIILVAGEEDISRYVTTPPSGISGYLRGAERPTTVIYRGAKNLPPNLVNRDGSIAIRLVKEVFCKTLIQEFGKPIVSTSANISGEPSPRNFPEINPVILEEVDYTVEYRRDDLSKSAPSRIVKIRDDGGLDIIRS